MSFSLKGQTVEEHSLMKGSKRGLGNYLYSYQRKGIGEKLLDAAIEEAKNFNLTYLEAWTRDDVWVQSWYEKMNFEQTTSYYH